MKLHDLENFIFDEFPENFNVHQMVFLSYTPSAQVLDVLDNPLPKIYTSELIYNQIILYCKWKRNIQFSNENFVILKANKIHLIWLHDKCLEVLMCESDEFNLNVMYLFKNGNRISHVYTGICSNIRDAVLNEIFVDWINLGVERLYMSIEYTDRSENDIDAIFTKIDDLLKGDQEKKIHLIIPLFGYEQFISSMADHFRACVALTGLLYTCYSNFHNMSRFVADIKEASIVISNNQQTVDEIKTSYKKAVEIFKIIEDHKNKIYDIYPIDCELLHWSPYPTQFHVKLLTSLISPGYIYNIPTITNTLPKSLLDLCDIKKRTQTIGAITEKPNEKKLSVYELKRKVILYEDDYDNGF